MGKDVAEIRIDAIDHPRMGVTMPIVLDYLYSDTPSLDVSDLEALFLLIGFSADVEAAYSLLIFS